MSFFEKKIVTIKIRNKRLKFYAVGQQELIEDKKSFEYYGNITQEQAKDLEIQTLATKEVAEYMLSKMVLDEEQTEKPEIADLVNLTSAEIMQIMNGITEQARPKA